MLCTQESAVGRGLSVICLREEKFKLEMKTSAHRQGGLLKSCAAGRLAAFTLGMINSYHAQVLLALPSPLRLWPAKSDSPVCALTDILEETHGVDDAVIAS